MGHTTKTNLDENIRNWKSTLSADSNLTIDNVQELESHLMDEMDALQLMGLNKEESFLVAQNRMGDKTNLSNEFAKVNKNLSFRNKCLPYLNGILMFIAFLTVAELFTHFFMMVIDQNGLSYSYLNSVSIGLLMVLTFLSIWFLQTRFKSDRNDMGSLRNIPLLISVIVMSKTIVFLSAPLLTRSLAMSMYGLMKMNLELYEFIFILLLFAVSLFFFYSLKREKKLKLVSE